MITCLIVDDEQHAIDILTHYVSQTPYLKLAGSTTNPMEALRMVNELAVDLIFLDIQMPELTGLEFIKAIHGKADVILTTAYSEFALESYELDVVDYLLKPIRFPRFLQAVQKGVDISKESATPSIGEGEAAKPSIHDDPVGGVDDYIFVKTESKGKLLKINLADIDYIEGMKNYVALHCAGRKTLVYTTMKELEERLPHKSFIRVQKSFIIPIAKITGIEGNLVRLKDVSADILIGENYKAELMKLVQGKMIQ